MSAPKWNDKDENGNYVYFDMHHEVYDHGNSEEEALAILIKYLGPNPPSNNPSMLNTKKATK